MEVHSDSPIPSSSEIINSFIKKMESEVAASQKSLHQILSDYLERKSRNPDLAESVEGIHFPMERGLSPEQVQQHKRWLGELFEARSQVLSDSWTPETHPWMPFGHPDLAPTEFDALIRQVRYTSIQLSQCVVDIQSNPIFLRAIDALSVNEFEKILKWIEESPHWPELLKTKDYSFVRELSDPKGKTVVLDFVRDLRTYRALLNELDRLVGRDANEQGLDRALELMTALGASTWTVEELKHHLSSQQEELRGIETTVDFFSDLSDRTGSPVPSSASEAERLMEAIHLLKDLSPLLRKWRQPQVLNPAQRIRIQAWADRAKPLLETRKRLAQVVQLTAVRNSEELRKVSDGLRVSGWFYFWKTAYRQSQKAYRGLLQPELLLDKNFIENRLEMADRLIEWANYLDQKALYEGNPEAKLIFEGAWRGIDTDFAAALEANTWASEIRTWDSVGDPWGQELVEYLTRLDELKLLTCLGMMDSGPFFETERFFRGRVGNKGRDLELGDLASALSFAQQETIVLLELTTLVDQMGFRAGCKLSQLSDVKALMEEIRFMGDRLQTACSLTPSLTNLYRGDQTDLSPIERALGYVRFVENSSLPVGIQKGLLGPTGPQRIVEVQRQLPQLRNSLAHLLEQLEKLVKSTKGQLQGAYGWSFERMNHLFQLALKNPQKLGEWVRYLSLQRNLHKEGLAGMISLYENADLNVNKLHEAYDLVLNTTLLRAALSASPGGEQIRPA